MTNELSEADAQKLFNEISAADGDPLKLDTLLSTPADEDEPDSIDPKVETQEENIEDAPAEAGDEDVEETTTEEEESPSETKATEKPAQEEGKGEDDPRIAELRAQLEKISNENHALRSQAGRVPHMQRKIKEIDKKLEELNQKAASPSNRPSATIQPKVLEKLKGIRETDPELAEAIAAAFEEANNGIAEDAINRERETLTLLRQQEHAAYQAEQVSRLLEMYPNAKEVVTSPSWSEWKSTQPDDIVHLAESDHADSVALAFQKYARDMKAKYPELDTTAAKSAAGAKVNNADAAKAAQIEEERRRKQATSAKVSSPNAPGKVSLPDDPEALFKKYSEEIRKQRTG